MISCDAKRTPTTQAILILRGAAGRRHGGFPRKRESCGGGEVPTTQATLILRGAAGRRGTNDASEAASTKWDLTVLLDFVFAPAIP